MARQLPNRLIVGLGAAATAFLILGVYLEVVHLQALQSHPIMTNLLSGLIAFPCASLAVALGFNWFTERERLARLEASIPEAWAPLAEYCTDPRISDQNSDDPGEVARLNSLLRLHEQLIKFRIPLVVHLLDLRDDFIVIRHLRMLEEQYAALSGPPKLEPAARRAGLAELSVATLNLIRRIATTPNGRKLRLPQRISTLDSFEAS
ncbi:MAG TPA: hypothetical protein VF657_19830 [Actinoplanes sp.]